MPGVLETSIDSAWNEKISWKRKKHRSSGICDPEDLCFSDAVRVTVRVKREIWRVINKSESKAVLKNDSTFTEKHQAFDRWTHKKSEPLSKFGFLKYGGRYRTRTNENGYERYMSP